MKYSVVIVDDEKMVVNSLALAFPWEETDFEVIATFTNSRTALEEIGKLRPNVVFSDIKMPGMNGLEMMGELKKQFPLMKVVFISGHEDFGFAKKALSLGASGYCLKPLEDDEIMLILTEISRELVNAQNTVEALFFGMLENNTAEGKEEIFKETLFSQFPMADQFCMAVSIYDMEAELQPYVTPFKIKYEENTYFYFFQEDNFLELPRFKQKIKSVIHEGRIKNFSFMKVSGTDNLAEKAQQLLNHVYSFFVTGSALDAVYQVRENREADKSSYFHLLETDCYKNKLNNVQELLKAYQELYPVGERTIMDAVEIYNLVMATMYRKDNQFFDEAMDRPFQLAESFANLDEMMQYLLETIGNQGSNYARKDTDRIKNNTFKQILLYINQNFYHQISFQNICKEYAINPSYLSQIFKKELGTTFTNYLTDLRVNYARELLESTNLTISEVSEKTGYDQYFYFSKVFKKLTGMSPSQYREEKWKEE